MAKNGMLNIVDKAFNYVDDGSFFRNPLRWVYIVLGGLGALLCLVLCIFAVVGMADSFGGGSMIPFYILIVLGLLALGGVTFLFWLKRSRNVVATSEPEDEIFVIPIIAHIVQCIGEISGLRTAVLGVIFFFFPIFAPLGMGIIQYLVLPFVFLILFIVAAYLRVVLFRFFAETLNAKAITANSAKKITRLLAK